MIPALFHEKHTAVVTVVTALDMARVAAMARGLGEIPRDDPRWAENPNMPWEPIGEPISILIEPGRTPQEKAA